MVELSEAKGNSANNIKLQLQVRYVKMLSYVTVWSIHTHLLFDQRLPCLQIMKTLSVLPISTKNMLEESRVLTFIQRWAQTKTLPQQTEMDGYSSENTSRAQTPLNTPDGSSAKMGPELDSDTSKPAVYRRLKIISENSLDSALSDASKASDGKEEEEEEEDEEDDENSRAGLPEGKQLKADTLVDAADPTTDSAEESGKEVIGEKQEEAAMTSSSEPQPPTEEVKEKPDLVVEEDSDMKEVKSEDQADELEPPKEPVETQESGKPQDTQSVTEKAELEEGQPSVKVHEPETQSSQTGVADAPPEQPSETMESQTEAEEAKKTPPSSEPHNGESTTDVPPIAEAPEATIPSEVTATPVDPSVIGTPSQDEEEGVSDVESERSQEPQLSVLDISGMAARLLESWKDLKVYS